MEMILISDTHGCADDILESLVPVFNSCTTLVHLGDGGSDLSKLPKLNCETVIIGGNTDPQSGPPYKVLTTPVGKILLAHGHTLGVSDGDLTRAYLYAAQNDCGYVFFGHTHTPLVTVYNGVTFVNPGSLGRPRGYGRTYAHFYEENGLGAAKIVSI